MFDVLTQVLDVLRINTTLFAMKGLPTPWGVGFPARSGAYFHVLAGGDAWLHVDGDAPSRLTAGDTVLLAHGTAHLLTDDPAGTALVRFDPATWQPNELVDLGDPDMVAGPSSQSLICGAVDVLGASSQPLLALLPEIVVVARDDPGADSLELTLRLLSRETRGAAPGSQTMLARLGDVLLLQLVRCWLERADLSTLGWLGGLQDKQIAAALAAMHAHPEVDWTVQTLARQATLSRSRFAQQFTARVGQAPLAYLTQWRLTLAAHQLRQGRSITEVSRAVGYRSEPAFSRAFSRRHGFPPSRVAGSVRPDAPRNRRAERAIREGEQISKLARDLAAQDPPGGQLSVERGDEQIAEIRADRDRS